MYLWPDYSEGNLKAGKSSFSIFAADPKNQCTEDDIQTYEKDLLEVIKTCATRILSGEAEKNPSKDSCRFCSVKAHCNRAVKPKEF